jgi:hypothetical protein
MALANPERRDESRESVALTSPSAVPRSDASRARVGQTSSLLKTSAVGASAWSARRMSAVVSNGRTSRKSTGSWAANARALGEKYV